MSLCSPKILLAVLVAMVAGAAFAERKEFERYLNMRKM